MKSRREQFTRRGFTIIELLVVITVIVVLASIALPVFTNTQERARATQDLSNLRQLGLATQLYLNDNDNAFFLPDTNWMKVLHPKYIGSWRVFQSPFDKRSPSESDTTAPVSYGFNANAKAADASPLLPEKIVNAVIFILYAPAQTSSSTVTFTGNAAPTAVTVDKNGASSQGTAIGGTHSGRKRINACMADLHVENMEWSTYKNGSAGQSQDPCAAQRWNPLATCP